MKTPKNVKTPAPVTPAPTAPVTPKANKTTKVDTKARENALKAPVAKVLPLPKPQEPKPAVLPLPKPQTPKPAAATHRAVSAKGSEAAKKAWVTIRANRAAAALAAMPAGKKAAKG